MKVKITVDYHSLFNTLSSHIDKRYKGWIDFAAFHCKKQNVKTDLYQLLEDVQDMVIKLDDKKTAKLFCTKRGNYNGLDLFVLRQIKDKIFSLRPQQPAL